METGSVATTVVRFIIIYYCLYQSQKNQLQAPLTAAITVAHSHRAIQGLTLKHSHIHTLTRALLGGGYFEPPSRFLAISSKPMQVSLPNLQYPLSQHFYILC